jgi:hypothetical protein
MPNKNDIYVGGDRVESIYRGASIVCELFVGDAQVYDGRPKKVSGLVGAYEDGTTTLSWINNSEIADDIRIEYKNGGTWSLIEKVATTETEYEHEWEPSAGTYEYRVLPENFCGYVTEDVEVEEVEVIAFALNPASVAFAHEDPQGTEKTTTLSCPNSWTRINMDYGDGPEGWFSTSPNSGMATSGATITVKAEVDIDDELGEWTGSATYQDNVTEATRVLVVAVEAPE